MDKQKHNTRLCLIGLVCSFVFAGCAASRSHAEIRVDGTQQLLQLRSRQNAVIHYLLDDGERTFKYCMIHSVNDRWLTVYDKEVKNSESREKSGWLSMIPIENIILIRVEE